MPRSHRSLILVVALAPLLWQAACDRTPAPPPTTTPTAPRIASLVPAATEILLDIGAVNRLVAVSNYDSSPAIAALPRVGDYQNIEWETLARLRPTTLIIQAAPDHVPPGLKQRAEQLGLRLVNVQINRLDDIYAATRQLGEVAQQQEAARQSADRLRSRLQNLRDKSAARKPVRVLIVRDADGQDAIGPGNFLDDLLSAVNGVNVAGPLGNPYPSIDRETILRLAPEAVIVLLPEARPQDIERAQRFWANLNPALPAPAHVCILTQRYALLPAPSLADLAERFSECLSRAAKGDPGSTAKPRAGATTRNAIPDQSR